jgi:RNA polymerase sigma-70 factor (ECF subfamily)
MSDLPLDDSAAEDAARLELADRLARGDEAAFAELYDACADRLHGFLAARLGSRDAASDILQNAFLRAVKSRRRFRGVENPVAYLFQIARNEALRLHAKQPRTDTTLPSDETLTAASPHFDDAEVVNAALAQLTADDRELVELKILAGFTFREIAEIVGRPQATVATQYRRALESIRPWLARQYR